MLYLNAHFDHIFVRAEHSPHAHTQVEVWSARHPPSIWRISSTKRRGSARTIHLRQVLVDSAQARQNAVPGAGLATRSM